MGNKGRTYLTSAIQEVIFSIRRRTNQVLSSRNGSIPVSDIASTVEDPGAFEQYQDSPEPHDLGTTGSVEQSTEQDLNESVPVKVCSPVEEVPASLHWSLSESDGAELFESLRQNISSSQGQLFMDVLEQLDPESRRHNLVAILRGKRLKGKIWDGGILALLVDVAEEFRLAARKNEIGAALLTTCSEELEVVALENTSVVKQGPLSTTSAAATVRPLPEDARESATTDILSISEFPRYINIRPREAMSLMIGTMILVICDCSLSIYEFVSDAYYLKKRYPR